MGVIFEIGIDVLCFIILYRIIFEKLKYKYQSSKFTYRMFCWLVEVIKSLTTFRVRRQRQTTPLVSSSEAFALAEAQSRRRAGENCKL